MANHNESMVLPVDSVHMLRELARVRRGHCRFLLRENTPLRHAPRLWESVEHQVSPCKWLNPEVLVGKGDAFELVEGRVQLLLNSRNKLDQVIASIDALLSDLPLDDEELDDTEEEEESVVSEQESDDDVAPKGFSPWRLRGPQLYATPEKIGHGYVDWRRRSRDVQLRAEEAGKVAGVDEAERYWEKSYSWKREQAALTSLNKFNRAYLNVKKNCLLSMRETIDSGAKSLVADFFACHTNLGATRLDLDQLFVDMDVHISLPGYLAVDKEDPMLNCGGDENKTWPPDKGEKYPMTPGQRRTREPPGHGDVLYSALRRRSL